jgi:HAE1 family hydrophobic/amphiphilic exporter-1
MGKSPDNAAIDGTTEIAVAVVASTMTNIVVFTPIAFMSGIIGQFFYQFGLTVVFATLFSLLVSFTLTPLLASRFFKSSKIEIGEEEGSSIHHSPRRVALLDKFEAGWDRFYTELEALYRGSLEWALRRRFITIAFAVVLLAFSFFVMNNLGGEFMPTLDQGFITVKIETPPGSSLQETDRVLRQVEEILANEPETISILASVGGANLGVEDGTIILKVVPKAERELGIIDYTNSLKPKLAAIPGAKIRLAVGAEAGGGDEGDISLELTGPDLEVLETFSNEILDSVSTVRGLAGIRSSVEEGKPELIFVPDRRQLDRYGLSSAAVAAALRTGYEGEVASLYRESDEEYDIRVRFNEDDRRNREAFYSTEIKANGTNVPLTQLGSVVVGTSPAEILRKDRQRLVRIDATVAAKSLSELVAEIQQKLVNLDLPPAYRLEYGGMYEFQQESFASMFEALILAVLLTYMVLAAVLESFVHPFTVMMTLPLGLVGMAFGLFLTGQTINIFSLMAFIMLVGIVVNNAILLLDYTGVLRSQGKTRREALIEACPVRLRPIIIANLAIAIGMLPQALGGAGSEFRSVMAVVTMGGVLVSAVFTMFLIPVIYDLLDRGK